ncbi:MULTISPECIES: ATP-binding protein [Streptomyces]|uniref:histidine kinase n=1 Tax=Streptomyces albus (strain ATCC 21838 / DSM 41398 / FERM P-419 / JCM 4703 / NBRC 107858) TaxID=1081613 RepID=A0A0B5F3L8_STRA4|nr:ATP-binding protein [Streptomyces sp. SCSIO ZS0520]AJE84872.1 ATP-binding region ATPase domain protein [Streptomyces albus]AOU79179.1 ATP-binding region ATPase domain protein [Streptomyces albus]AYN34911.1 histidine kinase [Streptomyces albus]
MTSLVQDPVFWVLIAVTLVALAAVLRARRTNVGLRKRNADLHDERGTLLGKFDELQAHQAGLRAQFAAELADVRSDAEEETKSVLKAAMRTLQSLADEQQVVIDQAQKKYGEDPQILADLMAIDHTNSQFGRRAQGIAVLCGGWLGRRESVASVYDVARSAQGRIRQFDRVRIHAQASFSVVSRAVEPVAVVLAELLANATKYSAPSTPVEINIKAVSKGVCLIVDDGGLGMGQEEKDRAAALLSPAAPLTISSLGNPPQFGFAVSGMLATRYGFTVSVDSVSPYGGVRAVILLPDELLTTEAVLPPSAASRPQGPTPVQQPPAAQPVAVEHPESAAETTTQLTPVSDSGPGPMPPVGTTAGGLPKRRRSSPVAVVPPAQQSAPEPSRSSQETASLLGAFQRGTRSGRTTTTHTEGQENS